MNTTMAPMDQIRQDSLEELRRRHDSLHGLRRRDNTKKGDGGSRRDGGSGGGGGGGGGGGSGSGSNGNGDGSGNGNGDSGKGGGNGNGNNDSPFKGSDNSGNKKANPTDNPPDPPSKPTEDPPQTPSATTAIVVSTTTAPAPAALTTSPTSTTPTPTFISSFFPTTTSFLTDPIFTIPTSADTSSQPRKGFNTDGDPNFSTSTSQGKASKAKPTVTITSAAIPQTALGSAPTTLAVLQPNDGGGGHHKKADGLSPLAEQLLIAAGAIGAFIMIVAGAYFLSKMMKIDLLSKFRNREFSRGGRRGWYGWRRKETDYSSDPPPVYPGEGFPSDEKSIPAQRQLEAFYSPMARPPLATPAGAAALSNADPQRQETVRAALLENPAPFGVSPVAETVTLSATQNFYNISLQNTNLSRQPGTQASQVSALSQQNTTLSRQPGTQVSLLSQTNSNYNNTGTQNTFLTRQNSDAYDPNQREVNHLSYLSSLSSGFGDGLIIPDSTVNGAPQPGYRQSRSQGAVRFSWVTSVRDRDTVYTQASIESAPRFRTINSWVAQQSSRVEKQQQSDAEVPAMPAIPLPLQAGVDHQRNPSEDPAFKAHPGEEIPISRGSRVPSEILDKTIGLK